MSLPRSLGDGLVLRAATAADVDAVAAFNGRIHADEDDPVLDAQALAVWTRELLDGGHPAVTPSDCTLVEDERTGEIVSSLLLIPQQWAYGGIRFPVGRVELVGTDERYRRRGLVGAQMAVMHRWGRERGHLAQGITGIASYYRRFGYEMAVEIGAGRSGPVARVPALVAGAAEEHRVRPATAGDAAFLAATAAASLGRYAVADAWDEPEWAWVAAGRSPGSLIALAVEIVEDRQGKPVGLLVRSSRLRGGEMRAYRFELAEGTPWPEVVPAVLRHLASVGREIAGSTGTLSEIGFRLGSDHAVYDVFPRFLATPHGRYAWYVRVEDMAAFLRHVAPVLEWRLADSAMAGFTGRLRVNTAGTGVALDFAGGLVAGIAGWQPEGFEDGDLVFPGTLFLQLVFGFHGFEELERSEADCFATTDAGSALAGALFPPGPAAVLGFG